MKALPLAKPKFITFEGVEGAGKTEILQKVAGRLSDLGVPHRVTREPGGTPLGTEIRRLLLDPSFSRLEPLAELLLYLADRVQHLHEVILPSLRAGQHVLSDRYHDATVVYQGYARGLGIDWSDPLTLRLGIKKPDFTVLLDLPPEIGLERARARNQLVQKADRFDSAALEFHRLVREGYRRLASSEPDRFILVDATPPPDVVYNNVAARLLPVLTSAG